MLENVARKMWRRVQSWFVANAEHVTVMFIPADDGEPLLPNGGYVRLWASEGFLAQQRTWGIDRFPALHGGVSLNVLGAPATFTTFARPPDAWTTPGAQLDFRITTLLPYTGGSVELEAALYQASSNGPLGTAVELISGLASLMGPPLATAAAVADKVSDGLDAVLAAGGDQPVLGVHWSMVAAGGRGNVLRPGHLAVIATPPHRLGGTPVIKDGRLYLRTERDLRQLTGVDYLVLWVECRTERDDWRLPELDALIRTAGDELIRGLQEAFAERRTEAIARAWNSADLTPPDRRRVALLVKEELDSLGQLGAVPGPESTLDSIAPLRLPSADDDRLADLTLARLLT
ncbi:MAG TPA: hypothetical protein VGJ95_11785 [Pseudonocardiaceae bacterium]|jgi:hypothetical protein